MILEREKNGMGIDQHRSPANYRNGTGESVNSVAAEEIIAKIELLDIPQTGEDSLQSRVGKMVIQSLAYEGMTRRYEEVTEAFPETYEWIFMPRPDSPIVWSDFRDWLENGGGVYWISGKAGSGKSTLMRFIYDDSRTHQLLSTWSNSSPVSIATFFFWNSGTLEQKSQKGLLRALLFQILNQHPALIPIVLPWLWAIVYSESVNGLQLNYEESWTITKLRRAFQALTEQTNINLRICLFIDGMDEFDGEHEELAQLLLEVGACPHVKVCLSSRPWVVFEDLFRCCPNLSLQDLTHADIQHYVQKSVYANSAFNSLASKKPDEALALINEIIDKADGVFLWVQIVVRSLLRGLRNRDEISHLQNRLRLFPRELGPLYNRLLELIEPTYLEWSSKVFQIVRAVQTQPNYLGEYEQAVSPELISVWDLYTALNSDMDISMVEKLENTSVQRKETRLRLTARCAGLLEVSEFGGVDRIKWLHRTARDFIEELATWKQILGHTAQTAFDPNVAMLRVTIIRLKERSSKEVSWDVRSAVASAMIYAHHGEQNTQTAQVVWLDHLENIIKSMPSAPERHYKGMHPLHSSAFQHESLSFLAVAVLYGLPAYVKKKLGSISKIPPLLCYAFPNGIHYPSTNSKTVEVLLRNGDSPNKVHTINGPTPWRKAMQMLHNKYLWDRLDRNQQYECIKALKLLIKYGADPQTFIMNVDIGPGSWHKVTVIQVITSRLGITWPDETAELLEMLKANYQVPKVKESGGWKEMVKKRGERWGIRFGRTT
jgi:hypothetical protein